jgi:hypothetical protein
VKSTSAIAALITAIALAGCAHTSVGVRASSPASTSTGAPAAGSAYSPAGIRVHAGPNVYFGLIFLGYVAAGVHDNYLRSSGGPAWREPPQLAEGRAIAERDCSLPMETPSANLRCR